MAETNYNERSEGEDAKRSKIHITIDGAAFTTRDDDQEAASLLRLAGRDPQQYNLARLIPGDDPKVIRDGKVIDLANGDAFVTVKERVPVTFTIDGASYTTRDDDQESAALLRLAGLNPAEYDLARIVAGKDPKVFKDEKILDLHEGDVFISVKQNSPVA